MLSQYTTTISNKKTCTPIEIFKNLSRIGALKGKIEKAYTPNLLAELLEKQPEEFKKNIQMQIDSEGFVTVQCLTRFLPEDNKQQYKWILDEIDNKIEKLLYENLEKQYGAGASRIFDKVRRGAGLFFESQDYTEEDEENLSETFLRKLARYLIKDFFPTDGLSEEEVFKYLPLSENDMVWGNGRMVWNQEELSEEGRAKKMKLHSK